MPEPVRTVLIYNPISGHGHLDSWNGMFVGLCLELGWRVVAITPDESALRRRLAVRGSELKRLVVIPWGVADRATLTRVVTSFARKAWRKWDSFGSVYLYRKPGSELRSDLPLRVLAGRAVCRATMPSLFRASYFAYFRLRRNFAAAPAGSADTDEHLLDPVDFALRARAAIRSARVRPDLVLNMYMDMYRLSEGAWQKADALIGAPWAGIRFVPSVDGSEPYYRVPGLAGICLLDQSVVDAYERVHPTKMFTFLPDVTNTRLPSQPSEIRQQIEARAGGRSIVFLGGSIGGQKNLAAWFKTIRSADPARFFFVQIGEVHSNTLSGEDRDLLAEFSEQPPENFFLHQQYLEDETAFNDILSGCRIIYAVYRNFKFSSNMLAKAARFKRPIVVSDRYLMGERVAHYGIGYLADEDDPVSILAALELAERRPIPHDAFERLDADSGEHHIATALKTLASAKTS